MKIYKFMMGSDINGDLNICDALLYEGSFWLVPKWIENPTEQYKSPARMIRVNESDYMLLGGDYPAEYLFKYPVPTPVLDGKSMSEQGVHYDVLSVPDIRISIRSDVH